MGFKIYKVVQADVVIGYIRICAVITFRYPHTKLQYAITNRIHAVIKCGYYPLFAYQTMSL
jgi:hypothetical protein